MTHKTECRAPIYVITITRRRSGVRLSRNNLFFAFFLVVLFYLFFGKHIFIFWQTWIASYHISSNNRPPLTEIFEIIAIWVIYLKTYNFILFALNTSCTGKGVFVFFFNGNGLHDMSGFGWVPTSDMVKVKLKLETIIYFAYAFLFMCMKKSMFFMISHASPPTNNPGQANGTFSNRTQSNSPQYLPVKHNRAFGNPAHNRT